jgi:[ribosomal protein S5]-alanine N-acetyltransferase
VSLCYDDRFAGPGWLTEAVQLIADFLFGAKKQYRIQLVIVPENAASGRIAEKCGVTSRAPHEERSTTVAATSMSTS